MKFERKWKKTLRHLVNAFQPSSQIQGFEKSRLWGSYLLPTEIPCTKMKFSRENRYFGVTTSSFSQMTLWRYFNLIKTLKISYNKQNLRTEVPYVDECIGTGRPRKFLNVTIQKIILKIKIPPFLQGELGSSIRIFSATSRFWRILKCNEISRYKRQLLKVVPQTTYKIIIILIP